MDKEYYYIDIDLNTKRVIDWGISKTASLSGDTNNPKVHRVFLTKGQFNKLNKLLL